MADFEALDHPKITSRKMRDIKIMIFPHRVIHTFQIGYQQLVTLQIA